MTDELFATIDTFLEDRRERMRERAKFRAAMAKADEEQALWRALAPVTGSRAGRTMGLAFAGGCMAPFVLVHGAWHGGWCWQRLTPLLTRRGHRAYAPSLTGLGDRAHLRACVVDLQTHVQDIVRLVEAEDLTDVVLVGHSLGGMKLPAIVEPIADRVAVLVNLDGLIPESGQAIKDLIPEVWARSRDQAIEAGDEGWAPPPSWDFGLSSADYAWVRPRLSPDPIITWESPIVFTAERTGRLPAHYISCTAELSDEEIAQEEEKSLQRGWQHHKLAAAHDVMVSEPELLAELLLGLPEIVGH